MKQPPEVFYKKIVFENFPIFTGKHLCWSLFSIKLQALLKSFGDWQKSNSRLQDHCTTQKMKFFIKDFFNKYEQIRRKLRIWSHLLKKTLMENSTFCAVTVVITIMKESKKIKNKDLLIHCFLFLTLVRGLLFLVMI